jgi:hypothetical protein
MKITCGRARSLERAVRGPFPFLWRPATNRHGGVAREVPSVAAFRPDATHRRSVKNTDRPMAIVINRSDLRLKGQRRNDRCFVRSPQAGKRGEKDPRTRPRLEKPYGIHDGYFSRGFTLGDPDGVARQGRRRACFGIVRVSSLCRPHCGAFAPADRSKEGGQRKRGKG